jgi:hypothetical protein
VEHNPPIIQREPAADESIAKFGPIIKAELKSVAVPVTEYLSANSIGPIIIAAIEILTIARRVRSLLLVAEFLHCSRLFLRLQRSLLIELALRAFRLNRRARTLIGFSALLSLHLSSGALHPAARLHWLARAGLTRHSRRSDLPGLAGAARLASLTLAGASLAAAPGISL